jgi:hypothetical protein
MKIKNLIFLCRICIACIGMHVAVASFSRSAEGATDAGTFADFIKDLPPASPSAIDVIHELRRIAVDTDAAPNDAQFFDLVKGANRHWTMSDLRHMWVAFAELQKSDITADDIIDIYRATRESTRSIYVEYSLSSTRNGVSTNDSCRFAAQQGNLLYSQKTGGGLLSVHLWDGTTQTVFKDESEDFAYASMGPKLDREPFYGRGNPLGAAMMLNSTTDIGIEDASTDLIVFLNASKAFNGLVRSQKEEFLGTPCVVVGSFVQRMFLDPARNFALIGFEELRYEFDKKSGEIRQSREWNERKNTKLMDCGNGLWIPLESVTSHIANGKIVATDSVHVSTIKLDESVPKGLFQFDIPKGTYVMDDLHNVSYQKGFDPSVEATLRGALTAQPSGIRSYLIAANAAVLIGLAFLWIWKWRHNRALQH